MTKLTNQPERLQTSHNQINITHSAIHREQRQWGFDCITKFRKILTTKQHQVLTKTGQQAKTPLLFGRT